MKRYRYEPCPRCRENGRDAAGDNLVVYSDDSAHCFSCRYHRPASFQVLRLVGKEVEVNGATCPADFTREVPAKCWEWLLGFGIPYSFWKESVGYSPSFQRLVFRVETFSIGRYFGPDDKRKWFVWGDCHKHSHLLRPANPADDRGRLVLVEDLISAAKLSVAGYNALPLFGTKAHACHLYVMRQFHECVLWLDHDQSHTVDAMAMRLSALTGVPITGMTTEQDPKLLSKERIQEVL